MGKYGDVFHYLKKYTYNKKIKERDYLGQRKAEGKKVDEGKEEQEKRRKKNISSYIVIKQLKTNTGKKDQTHILH